MKFNFDDISYTDVQGYSLLKKSPTDSSERDIRAGKLLDTLLEEPTGGLSNEDSISDFYSAIGNKGVIENPVQQFGSVQILNQVQDHNTFGDNEQKASTQKRNLAINKNTADRHGRT